MRTTLAIALMLFAGTAEAVCLEPDLNEDGQVTLADVQMCASAYLGSCLGSPTPTPTSTSTPTLGPSDCCDIAGVACGPVQGSGCPLGSGVYGAACDGMLGQCATFTPTPTATPTGRFVDNGDGTITDNQTGLMWEKKDDSGGIHDKNNLYTWSGASYGGTFVMDGTISTTFLATLNAGAGFAGHTDWRIPSIYELQRIVNYDNSTLAVDAAFNTTCAVSCTVTSCSCTQSTYYWSVTTTVGNAGTAWGVHFGDGFVNNLLKDDDRHVRAVR